MHFDLTHDYSRARNAVPWEVRRCESLQPLDLYCGLGANQVLAESARVTTAAPSMMASLMISRPAPERYGNPCVEAGTHASGVVIKNESVVRDIRNCKWTTSLKALANTTNSMAATVALEVHQIKKIGP